MANEKEIKTKSVIANSRVGIIDKESGELLDEGSLILVPKKMRIKGFFMAMQAGFEFLAKQKLNGESLNVMLFLMSRMNYENEIHVTNAEICDALGMKKQNVHRAIKCLRLSGALDEPEPKAIRISIDVAWKGKVSNLRREQNQQAKMSLQMKPIAVD